MWLFDESLKLNTDENNSKIVTCTIWFATNYDLVLIILSKILSTHDMDRKVLKYSLILSTASIHMPYLLNIQMKPLNTLRISSSKGG